MISVIREMIVQPVQVISNPGVELPGFNPIHYGLLLVALLVIGVVYRLVSIAHEAQDAAPEEKR
jgi:hypothetical protein